MFPADDSANVTPTMLAAKRNLLSDCIARKTLRNHLDRLGAFAPQRRYYLRKFLVTFGLFGFSLICLSRERLWVVLPAAVLLAFAGTQLGFLGHDLGHRQVCRYSRFDDMLGLLIMNLFLGFSYGWWTKKHNEHHANPNHVDLDPDIRFPVVAFTVSQAKKARGFLRYIIQFQAFLVLPLLFFLTASMWRDSVSFLASSTRSARRQIEILLLAAHLFWYLSLIIGTLGLAAGSVFILVHHAVFGLYLGLSFATNHKGMVILYPEDSLGRLERQIVTTRNLKAGPIVDYVFGPLGAQIEHHIFPDLPRNQLRRAAEPVKAYCVLRSIPYHETGVFEAFTEVFAHLQQIGRQLRRSSAVN